jgi:hypothetical protein
MKNWRERAVYYCRSKNWLWICVYSFLLFACAAQRTAKGKWVQLEDWDTNGNHALDRVEFQKGYVTTGFYKYWTCGSKTGTCSCVLTALFDNLDFNHDGLLQKTESSQRQTRYIIGPDAPKWSDWDDDHSGAVDRREFNNHAMNENLCGNFDPNVDRVISVGDLATAMFSICDQDKDASIGAMEFYLWEIYQKGVE